MDIQCSIRNSLIDAQNTLNDFINNTDNITVISEVASLLQEVFTQNRKVFTCGNGGSMCDAIHFAEECTGRFRHNRRPLPVIALSDVAHITCTANDYDFADIFVRPILALGNPDDLLIAISTSGNSENVVRAAAAAKSRQMYVFGLIGQDGGQLKPHCDKYIIAPGHTADRTQEIHIKVLHILIEHVERLMFPENY